MSPLNPHICCSLPRTRAARYQIFIEDQDVAEGAAVHGRRRARGHEEDVLRLPGPETAVFGV